MVKIKNKDLSKKNYFQLQPREYFFLILIIILISIAGYFIYRSQTAEKQLKKIVSEKNPVQSTIDKVGQLIELPKNEVPTVASITDKNKLQNQKFFSNAKNGDIVLIYTKAQKAILYRPSVNKIIEYSSINIGPSSLTITPTMAITEAAKKIKVAVFNGTKIVGLASQTKDKIEDQINGVEVVSIGDTVGSDYEESLIIDLTGKNQKKAQELADFLQGKVVKDLPEGEKKPDVDILVILGR